MSTGLRLLATLILACGISGCSGALTPVGPKPPESYASVGPATGSACGFLLFDLIPLGINDRVERAYAEALRRDSATALLDTKITNSWYYVFFGVVHCTEVAGVAIRAN
jgi:hypothetical protein